MTPVVLLMRVFILLLAAFLLLSGIVDFDKITELQDELNYELTASNAEATAEAASEITQAINTTDTVQDSTVQQSTIVEPVTSDPVQSDGFVPNSVISDNMISANAVSADMVSGNTVSESTISSNTVSDNSSGEKTNVEHLMELARTRELTEDDLKDLSSFELSAARNGIYAYHGYVFKSEQWNEYYADFDWYTGDPGFRQSDLPGLEGKNAAIIRAYEEENGGLFRY